MDRKEYKIRLEEIMTLIAGNQFQEALKIADRIDWREVRSFGTLEKISNLYKVNRRFEDAFEIAEFAYEYNPVNSNIVYSLCELSIELNNLVLALEFLTRYRDLAPNNPANYILEYKIKELGNATLEEKIDILENYKRKDFKQEWVYQLAYLYHRVGLATKCVETCDELITMMGDGPFVIKAMELKMLHTPLSKRQQAIYDNRNSIQEEIEAVESDEYTAETPEPGAMPELGDEDFHVKTIDMSKFNTINLQKALADSMKELLGEEEDENSKITNSIMEPMMDDKDPFTSTDRILGSDYEVEELANEPEENYIEDPYPEDEDIEESIDEDFEADELDQEEYYEDQPEEYYEEDSEYYDENGEEYYDESEEVFFEDKTGDIVMDQVPFGMVEDIIPSVPSNTKKELTEEEAIALAAATITKATGNTGRIRIEDITTGTMKDVSEEVRRLGIGNKPNMSKVRTVPRSEVEKQLASETEEAKDYDETIDESLAGIEESDNLDNTGIEENSNTDNEEVKEFIKVPRKNHNDYSRKGPFDEVLSQDNDGQISMAMPKTEPNFEKQITGQMNFQEVIAGWEEYKKEREKKQKESINNKILESTGKIFENYDNELKNGILAQLEEEERHNKRLIKNDLELHKVDDFKLDNNLDIESQAEEDSVVADIINDGVAAIGAVAAGVVAGAASSVASGVAAEAIESAQSVKSVESAALDIAGDILTAGEEDNNKDNNTENNKENNKEDKAEDVVIEKKEEEAAESENADKAVESNEENVSEDNRDSENEELLEEGEETYIEEYYDENGEPYDDEYYDENGEPYDDEEYYDENGEPYDDEEYYDEDGESYDDEEYYDESEMEAEESEVEESEEESEEEAEDKTEVAEESQTILDTAQINDIGSVLEANADAVKREVADEINDENNPQEDRDLSVEEQELFADFMYSKKMKNQILEAVDVISLAPYVGNVLLTGEDSTTAIELAKSLIKQIQILDANFIAQKVAKISGGKMNKKDINGLFAQLSNGALIIEKAGEMNKDTLENITKAFENTQDGILIILIDTKKAIDKMTHKYAMLEGYFNVRVDILPMTDNALVEYAKKYAYSKEYKIDEERAVLALHQRISELQIGDHYVTTSEIEDIVDEAIKKSGKFRISTIFNIVAGKRYDSFEDMIVLREKDFS